MGSLCGADAPSALLPFSQKRWRLSNSYCTDALPNCAKTMSELKRPTTDDEELCKSPFKKFCFFPGQSGSGSGPGSSCSTPGFQSSLSGVGSSPLHTDSYSPFPFSLFEAGNEAPHAAGNVHLDTEIPDAPASAFHDATDWDLAQPNHDATTLGNEPERDICYGTVT